ncbi:MAG: cupin domain-containing protein [Leptolyngbya sp.]|nr:cupin domain-containing protein [Leptolyngbya sp.]
MLSLGPVVYAIFCPPTAIGAPQAGHPALEERPSLYSDPRDSESLGIAPHPPTPMSTILTPPMTTLQLHDHLEFPHSGVISKVLWNDAACQYTLFCLAAGAAISEHTSSRHATVNVVAGSGTLVLEGQCIDLEPGVFALIQAHTPHALAASTNLAFLLTLSARGE